MGKPLRRETEWGRSVIKFLSCLLWKKGSGKLITDAKKGIGWGEEKRENVGPGKLYPEGQGGGRGIFEKNYGPWMGLWSRQGEKSRSLTRAGAKGRGGLGLGRDCPGKMGFRGEFCESG